MNHLPYLWIALVLLCLAGPEAEADPPLAVSAFDSDQAKALQKAWADHLGTPVQITNLLGMKLNLIPPGEFVMGSPKSEPARWGDETQHRVQITRPFYLGAHEVTQAQYERVSDRNRSLGNGPTKPVEQVSWHDAVAFCDRLSEREGVEYRLPTEAEWEYACRAGTTSTCSFGNDVRQLPEYAWYRANSKKSTHPVGELKPNAWGLYDMHGNVWEWCQDWYGPYECLQVVSDPAGPASESGRVLRGGAFLNRPEHIRAADRSAGRYPSGHPSPAYGFRVARTCPLSP